MLFHHSQEARTPKAQGDTSYRGALAAFGVSVAGLIGHYVALPYSNPMRGNGNMTDWPNHIDTVYFTSILMPAVVGIVGSRGLTERISPRRALVVGTLTVVAGFGSIVVEELPCDQHLIQEYIAPGDTARSDWRDGVYGAATVLAETTLLASAMTSRIKPTDISLPPTTTSIEIKP